MKTFNFFELFRVKTFCELREAFYNGTGVKVFTVGTSLIPYSDDKLEKKLFKAAKIQNF